MSGLSLSRDVRDLLTLLVERQAGVLGHDLVGSCVFGSVVTGGFEPGVSDVDTVAVLRSDPTPTELESIGRLHAVIVEDMPEWDDRVEAVYLSARALEHFRSGSFPAARISPGEPFHAIEIDDRWLIDWYQLRTVGVALTGPPATSLVPLISQEEWVRAVRRHLLEWPEGDEATGSLGQRAYVILSMCRGLRTVRIGDHVSKLEAARWAAEVLSHHAALIHAALEWRRGSRDGSPLTDGSNEFDPGLFIAHVKALLA